MLEEPLQVRLEGADQHSGQYTLTFGLWQYPVTLKPERDVMVSEWLRRLRPVLVGNNDPEGNRDPQDLLHSVGTWLWQALFPESAPAQEREALTQALRTGRTPLLLILPDELAELPWELLCDPEQSGERGFLAHRRPLMRLSPSATPMAPVEPPLRVLLLISSPPSLGEDSRIDVESERAAVEQAVHSMREAGLVHLLVEDIVTPKRVQQVLMRFKPHIVHYIGHGGYSDTGGGALLWEDEQGNEFELSTERLADLLRPRNLYAVVLHACQTGRSNAQMDIHSVAGMLIKEGIPAVLAQQANFTYESSQRASEAWYTALAAGQSMVDALFELRQALSQADRPDWAVPTLQGSIGCLASVLGTVSLLRPADPLLANVGAATDLPTPTGFFVGRHREMRALRLMLESMPGSGSVIALITGPGGVGKSTLAAQAISRYGRTYKAVLTLRCQEYQGIDLFLQRIGEFLKRLSIAGFLEWHLPDPKLSIEAKVEEAIAALNAVGPLLLVIDNLESVQNDDQTISDKALLYLLQKLLTNLRSGRVLITGRYALPDLLPHGKFAANLQYLNLEDLSPYETSQLLLGYPTLAVLGEVVRQKIVREFGGLPYVYDLLSSKAASQSLDLLIHDMQGRITQEHKRRTAEEWQDVRQQTVEFAALEATVSCLSIASRVLLTQLSVLHRPFLLITIAEGLEAVRTVWQPLLDRSLLHYDPQEKTYHLHNLTRHYAEGLLNEHDRKQVQKQLATWYEHYADQDSHELGDALEAYRLWRAAGNVQQAGNLVMMIAESLRRFGFYTLLRDLCAKTLSDIHGSDELLRASILQVLGSLAILQGEYEEARRFHQQSLEIFNQLGSQDGRIGSLCDLGIIAQNQGKFEEARWFYQQCLETLENQSEQTSSLFEWWNQADRARSLHQLGNLAILQGDYEEARRFHQQSLEIREQLTDKHGRAQSLRQLGFIAQNQGEYREARRLYQQSLEIFEQLGDMNWQAGILHNLGTIAQNQEEYEQAYTLYQQSLEIFERLGDQNGQAGILHELGRMARRLGEYEQAYMFYQQSLKISEQLGNQRGRASSLGELGMLSSLQGKHRKAHDLYQQSLEIFERLGDQNGRAQILRALGELSSLQGEYRKAHDLYQQSLKISEQLGDQSERASFLHELGMIAMKQGEYEEARSFYQQGLAIAERLDDQIGRAKNLHELGLLAYLQGEYVEAHEFYQQSLEIAERLGSLSGQASSLHQLGMIAQKQREYEKACRLHQQSLEIAERLGSLSGQAKSLHNLGIVALSQGKYQEAHVFYQQSLKIFGQLGDQGGQAESLHELGKLAQEQGKYEEASRLYQQRLRIFEQLGNQHEQAKILIKLCNIALHQEKYEEVDRFALQRLRICEQLGDQDGQANSFFLLGTLAYIQEENEKALMYLVQCYILFDLFDTSTRTKIQKLMNSTRVRMGDVPFAASWQAFAGNCPLPLFLDEEKRQQIIQIALEFIRIPTWRESKHFLETHSELLQPEIDPLLQVWESQQEQERVRKTIEEHRLLLARCRDEGIDAVFAALDPPESPETLFVAELNSLCNEAITIMREGNAERREELAARISQLQKYNFAIEGIPDFIQLLVAWLYGQKTQTFEEKLQPRFRDAYAQMLAAAGRGDTENTDKEEKHD